MQARKASPEKESALLLCAADISEATMIGWWDDEASQPVRSSHLEVRVTSYVKKGNATLLAIASWAATNLTVRHSASSVTSKPQSKLFTCM